ncbi:I78 family peptidase inhibitor [Delftia sp. PS-11]|uniref:I78 family peptidase inhibitor n=1 Tax=Delftia sp. PS-11 TaxID=2767222 RepID=UPI0024580AD2|nr:I78 family peptidase inhibitor [Delftia sp. PS-11]KAJ8743735.1 hypothetical protein H9T68_16215 [Delftia sp. PS-11]
MPQHTRHLHLSAGAAWLAAAALLAGCTGTVPRGHASPGTAAAPRPLQICNAAAVQSFVGKSNTSATLESARLQSGSYMARILREGQQVSQEFNQERLNLHVDGAGRITAVRCG